MPTTTATTPSPPLTDHEGLTVRQRVSRPALDVGVRERIAELHDRGVRVLTLTHFEKTARSTGRPLSWVGDHLIVLEGVGILRRAVRGTERAWTVVPGSEYLR